MDVTAVRRASNNPCVPSAHSPVDEEGGARVTDSKTRFVAPALAVLALAGATAVHDHPLDEDDAGFGTGAVRHGNDPAAQSLGGFLGFGLIGASVARLSHPIGIAFAAVGVAQTLYANVLGKGRDVDPVPPNTSAMRVSARDQNARCIAARRDSYFNAVGMAGSPSSTEAPDVQESPRGFSSAR